MAAGSRARRGCCATKAPASKARPDRIDHATGGGWPSTFGRWGSMQAQVGALLVQIVLLGRTTSGSSSAPARMKTRVGRDSDALKRWVPQTGQKRRCILLPLSATLSKSRSSPVTLTAADLNAAPTVGPPAPIFWHTLHQQTLPT